MEEKNFVQKHPYFSLIIGLALVVIVIIAFSTFNFAYDIDSCEKGCSLRGYDNSSCFWPSEAGTGYFDLGKCYIEQSRHCGTRNQCICYCYDKPVACTEDARICPDGTAVVRIAPNCEFGQCPAVANCLGMEYSEAVEIAEASACMNNGTLKENYVCNEVTATWWIDLEPIETMEYCPNPACVVYIESKTAEINWRCMGALPP